MADREHQEWLEDEKRRKDNAKRKNNRPKPTPEEDEGSRESPEADQTRWWWYGH